MAYIYDNSARSPVAASFRAAITRAIHSYGWLPVATVFTLMTLVHGIPSLRHDWSWPLSRSGWFSLIVNSTSGWVPGGLGSPNPLPAGFIVKSVIGVLVLIAGPRVALALACTLFVLLLWYATVSVADQRDSGPPATRLLLVLALTFNPWTYTELVAGHIYMLIAFGALVYLAAVLTDRSTCTGRIIFGLVCAMTQLQMFLIGTAFVAAAAVAQRRLSLLWWPLLLWLPLIVGLLTEGGSLWLTPLTLQWQQAQSIPLLSGVLLGGYFAHYAPATLLDRASMTIVVGIALSGAIASVKRLSTWVLVSVYTATLILAAGADGPANAQYMWAIQHFKALAVFRELYDLLAVVLIVYGAFLLEALRRYRLMASIPLSLALIGLLATWLTLPPSHYWISAAQLQKFVIPRTPNTRYALLPAFQPLISPWGGDGADPDEVVLPGNVTPFDTYLPTFTQVLGQAGGSPELRAFSVSTVVFRPCLLTDEATLRDQLAYGIHEPSTRAHSCHAHVTRFKSYTPELGEVQLPYTADLPPSADEDAVFFSDVAGIRGADVPPAWQSYHKVSTFPQTLNINPRTGWVDARLAYLAKPRLALPLDGITTASDRAIRLPPGDGGSVLLDVEGSLVDGRGNTVVRDTRGFAWARLPAGARSLRCYGTCTLIARGSPARIPAKIPRTTILPVSFTMVTPWLAVTYLRGGAARALRFNVTFDQGWQAFIMGSHLQVLTHFKLDSMFNAWIIPAQDKGRFAIILDLPSLLIAICQLTVLVFLAGYAAFSWPRRRYKHNVPEPGERR